MRSSVVDGRVNGPLSKQLERLVEMLIVLKVLMKRKWAQFDSLFKLGSIKAENCWAFLAKTGPASDEHSYFSWKPAVKFQLY